MKVVFGTGTKFCIWRKNRVRNLQFGIRINFVKWIDVCKWIWKYILNRINFGIWGRNRTLDLKFGMRVFDVVFVREIKDFFSKFEQ